MTMTVSMSMEPEETTMNISFDLIAVGHLGRPITSTDGKNLR